MNRAAFRRFATDRLNDATALFSAKRYSGAYYIAGYSVECALKACVAKQTRRSAFPARQTSKETPYTHDLGQLLRISGLKTLHDQELNANPVFQTYWNVVRDWSEEARYSRHSKSEAADILTAITNPTNGVMQWIVQRW